MTDREQTALGVALAEALAKYMSVVGMDATLAAIDEIKRRHARKLADAAFRNGK